MSESTMGLAGVLDSIVTEKKEKAESKHYIPFSHSEWVALEAQAGRKLEPKDLKLMINNIFNGALVLTKKPA
jgi:hypothetical protein